MKLIIDVPDTLRSEGGDLIPQHAQRINTEATVTVSTQSGAYVVGSVDGWKSDGRTSRRLCATYAGAKADAHN